MGLVWGGFFWFGILVFCLVGFGGFGCFLFFWLVVLVSVVGLGVFLGFFGHFLLHFVQ